MQSRFDKRPSTYEITNSSSEAKKKTRKTIHNRLKSQAKDIYDVASNVSTLNALKNVIKK